MKKILKYVVLEAAILAIVFFALNAYINHKEPVSGESPIVAENPEGEADPARMKLDMNEWTWISALYNDSRGIKPAKPGAFRITFGDDGKFVATTDCNGITGHYIAQEAGKISFSQLAMTKMHCEGSQEGEFVSILQNASGYHFTSRGQLILDLKSDSGSATFR